MSVTGFQAGIAVALLTFGVADISVVAVSHRSGAGWFERVAARARSLVPGIASDQGLRLRAARAGLSSVGEDLLALKIAAALVAGLVMIPAIVALDTRRGVLVLGVISVFAFFAPDLALSRRIAKRRARLALELPAMLDLLAVTIGAGLGVGAALDEVARRHGGLFGKELRMAQRATDAGATRAQALSGLRDRCPHEAVSALVSAIDRADRHGAELAPALRAIATDARQDRARAIREHAARAAPQIQLVIALGLVPATILIVAAGLVASLST